MNTAKKRRKRKRALCLKRLHTIRSGAFRRSFRQWLVPELAQVRRALHDVLVPAECPQEGIRHIHGARTQDDMTRWLGQWPCVDGVHITETGRPRSLEVVNLTGEGEEPDGAQTGKSMLTTQRLIAESIIRYVNILKMCRKAP